MKEGSTSNVIKQSSGATTGTASTPSEFDAVGNENGPSSSPLEAQQKMEVELVTPAAGTSKSLAFKLGMLPINKMICLIFVCFSKKKNLFNKLK